VIVDQVGRPNRHGPLPRLLDLTTLPRLEPDVSPQVVAIGAAVMGVLFLVAATRAARWPIGRAALGMVAVQLAVLLLAPPWFPYYTDYLAVPVAMTIAAAAMRPAERRAGALAAWLPLVAASTVTALVIGLATWVSVPFHGAETLSSKVAHVRCVMSDSPMALIELNALSRGLAAGCPDWIDDTGVTYGADQAGGTRSHDPLWQRAATHYLRSGGAVILFRAPRAAGLDLRTRRKITENGLLDAAGGHRIYRVVH
jgi:hypothetical protein